MLASGHVTDAHCSGSGGGLAGLFAEAAAADPAMGGRPCTALRLMPERGVGRTSMPQPALAPLWCPSST